MVIDVRFTTNFVGLESGKGIEKDGRRRIETAHALNTTVWSCLPKVVLHNAAMLAARLADDHVSQADVSLLIDVETRDTTTDAHEKAVSQRHSTGDRGGLVGSHLASG